MPDFSIENKLEGNSCGIDEVGRGTLVGPVIAACLYIPENKKSLKIWSNVNDSKKLSKAKRELYYCQIIENAEFGIGVSTIGEIDQINILNASLLAMERAYYDMNIEMENALIDGNKKTKLQCNQITVVKGDSKSISIAAASIIAKVTRDRLLEKMGIDYPEYNWAKNSGYGTKEHLNAIKKLGITEHHRKTFSPIKEYILENL